MSNYKLTIVLLFIGLISFGQQVEIDNNIIKYWNYRDRLVKNFISIGSEAGQSLPFGTRNEKGSPFLSQGEGPIMLGQYIGVLATEYNLLKQSNSDTSQTLKELYYALYAFNRLDLTAETVNGYNKKPKLDGFFIREDFPNDFITKNPSLNENNITKERFIYGSGQTFKVNCTTHKGTKMCDVYVKKDCSVAGKPKGYSTKYNHKPMSMDQILGVLIGVSLVNKLVDNDTNFNNKTFQDNEFSIKQEAKNIAKRILTYARHKRWTPKEPDGDYTGDCDYRSKSKPNFFKNNTTIWVFGRFFSHIGNNIFGEKLGYTPFIGFLDGIGSIQGDNFKGDFWNRRMYIEMLTLSNKDNHLFLSTGKKVISASKKYNWQPFYYNLGKILHHWKDEPTIDKQSLTMLSSAPFNGPYYHTVDDLDKNGWATKNRFSATLGEQNNGSRFPEINGNYSGLDYMLLHNMYLLSQEKKYSSYSKLKTKQVKNIKPINFKTTKKECLKSKKQSCKERKSYLRFLSDLHQKKCKESKAKCKEKSIKYIEKKFRHGLSPIMKCTKKALLNKCHFD